MAGGRKGISRLVDRFYELMEQKQEVEQIRQMHPQDLSESRLKLFRFLCGWFGGPNLYWEHYGHPRMRARHMKFPIDENARDQWLLCMRIAIDETTWNKEFKDYTFKSFSDFARHMQNRK